ncbi:MAG TPA: hypothetical protein VKT30_13750 [Caulobacteraceae bacterium]|nr:hypothetical protein [Caulobacteraceae bacterium]
MSPIRSFTRDYDAPPPPDDVPARPAPPDLLQQAFEHAGGASEFQAWARQNADHIFALYLSRTPPEAPQPERPLTWVEQSVREGPMSVEDWKESVRAYLRETGQGDYEV